VWRCPKPFPEGVKTYKASDLIPYIEDPHQKCTVLCRQEKRLVDVKDKKTKKAIPGQKKWINATVSTATQLDIDTYLKIFKKTPDLNDVALYPDEPEKWHPAAFVYPLDKEGVPVRLTCYSAELGCEVFKSTWGSFGTNEVKETDGVTHGGDRVQVVWCTQNQKFGKKNDLIGSTSAKDMHKYMCDLQNIVPGPNDDPINHVWRLCVIDDSDPNNIKYYVIPFGKGCPWSLRLPMMPIAKKGKQEETPTSTSNGVSDVHQKPKKRKAAEVIVEKQEEEEPVVKKSKQTDEEIEFLKNEEEKIRFLQLKKQLQAQGLDKTPATAEIREEPVIVNKTDGRETPTELQSSPDSDDEDQTMDIQSTS
jgi:hypothetical protein